jgi:hypothetical protein
MQAMHGSPSFSVGMPQRGQELPDRGTTSDQHGPHRPRSPPPRG